MSHSVANIRAYQCELEKALQAAEGSTQQNRVACLQALWQLVASDSRSQEQSRHRMQKYEQYFSSEFDVTIQQVNGEQHKMNVSGNTTILNLCSELAQRLKRQPEELQFSVNAEVCRSQGCLRHYGVVKAHGDQVLWLTFRKADACTAQVNTAKQEYSGAWRIEIGEQFEHMKKRYLSKIVQEACSVHVLSTEEGSGLLQDENMSVAHLCGILSCQNQCENHTCSHCKQHKKTSGDCSFLKWMETKRQSYEAESVALLGGSQVKLQRRQKEMDYSLKLSKDLRSWKGGVGASTTSSRL